MKRLLSRIIALVLAIVLCGCAAGEDTAGPAPALVPEGGFSPALYEALEAEWTSWNALSGEWQMLSSHTPGYCTREFDDWAELEAFVGLELSNPLEALETLEKGNWAAAPAGYNGAKRFYVTWYGTEDGHVQWLQIDSGYRREDQRICLSMTLYSDPVEEMTMDSGWSVEHQRLSYLQESPFGEPFVTVESGEEYDARTAVLARGQVLYTLRVIGAPGAHDALTALLAELLPPLETLPG